MTTQNWIEMIGWGSPVGLGVFFIGLGVFFAGGSAALYLLAKTGKMDLTKKD